FLVLRFLVMVMVTRIRSLVEKRALNHSFGPCLTPLSVRDPSCLSFGSTGGGGGGGAVTTVVTEAELSAELLSAGVVVSDAVATSVPLAATFVTTVTVATRLPDRASRSQLSVVVPVQPGPRLAVAETNVTCAGR